MTDLPPGQSDTASSPGEEQLRPVTDVSGGVELDAQRDVHIGGDVVGRDKIENIAGDKVAGNKIVEQELTATGTHVIQIGKLNLPLVPLLAVLGVGLAVLIFIGLSVSSIGQQLRPTPTPGTMSSANFDVVVAEFGDVDQAGQVHVSEQSRALSQSVYDTLIAQRDAFPDPIIKSSIAIRYGNLPSADNLVADDKAAASIAEQIGADMLIYGNLDQDRNFTPQFYISPHVRAEVDALMTGNQNMGRVPFTPGASFGAGTDLRTRASMLFFIATGLTYDVFGRAARALEVYRQAEQALADWPEQGAGKEILYFYKGQAALFQAQQTTGQPSTDLLNEAEEAFRKALVSNPAYARAHVGLGSADLIRLQRLPDLATAVDMPETATMFDQYRQAITLTQQAGDRQVEAIATFSLGSANYMLGGAYQFRADTDHANAAYTEAARLIDSSRTMLADFKQPRLSAQADLALGAVYDQQAQLRSTQGDSAGSHGLYQRAQQAYAQCVARGQNSADRILLDLIIAQRCQPDLDKVNRLLQGGS